VQLVGDLAVGPALGDREQDLLLPVGERLDGLGRSGLLVGSAKAASSRTVTLGAMSASPSAAAWIAWVSRAGRRP
jgi:hypothetical protein